jgi:hypothetical protein
MTCKLLNQAISYIDGTVFHLAPPESVCNISREEMSTEQCPRQSSKRLCEDGCKEWQIPKWAFDARLLERCIVASLLQRARRWTRECGRSKRTRERERETNVNIQYMMKDTSQCPIFSSRSSLMTHSKSYCNDLDNPAGHLTPILLTGERFQTQYFAAFYQNCIITNVEKRVRIQRLVSK